MKRFGRPIKRTVPSDWVAKALWSLVLTLPLLGYSQTVLEPVWSRGATPINAQVAISQDGSTIVVSDKYRAWYWRVADGNLRGSIDLANDVSYAIAVSPDGSLIAGSYLDASVRLWRTSDGALLGEFSANDVVHAVAFAPDASALAVAAGMWHPMKVYLLNPTTMTAFDQLTLSDYPYAVAFSPNGETVAIGDSTGKVTLWRRSEGTVRELTGHTSSILSLAFSPNGDLLATASTDPISRQSQVIVWDVQGETPVAQWTETNAPRISVAFSPSGSELALAVGSEIRLRLVPSGAPLNTIAHTATSVAFMSEGTLVSDGGGVRFWQVPNGTLVDAYKPEHAFAWMPNGNTIISTTLDETLFRSALQGSIQATVPQGASRVAVSPDGGLMALSTGQSSIQLWNLNTSSLLTTLPATNYIRQLAFSPNGAYLASLGSADSPYLGYTVSVWQMPTATSLYTVSVPPSKAIYSFAFSPDSSLMALVDAEGAVLLYRTSDGQLISTLQSDYYGDIEAYFVTFSPAGSLLAFSLGTHVEVWNYQDGSLLYEIPTYPNHFAYSVATSPDGVLAIGSGEKISFWRMADGALLDTYVLARLNLGLERVEFSPTGEYIAIGDSAILSVAHNPLYRMPGDVNGDGCVDEADLLLVLFAFGTDDTQADLNRDGVVNDIDVLEVLFTFGSGC